MRRGWAYFHTGFTPLYCALTLRHLRTDLRAGSTFASFFVCLSCIEFDLSGPPHIWTEKMMEKLSEKNKNRFLKGGLRSCTLSCFQLERLRKHQEHHSDSDFQAKGFSDVYRAYRDQTSSSNKLQVKHSSGLLVSQLPLSDVKLAPAKLDCFGLPTVSQLFFFVLTEPLALIDKLY